MTLELDQFSAWLAQVLAVSGKDLLPSDSRETVSEWDSLGSLLVLMRLEEDFGVVVEARELESIASVADLHALYSARNPGR